MPETNKVFDFDTWKALAINDPQTFEEKRTALIQAVIAQSNHKIALERLQWRIDSERRKIKNPLTLCQKLFWMIYEQQEKGLISQTSIYYNNVIPFKK